MKILKAQGYVPVITSEIPVEAVKRMTLKDWREVKARAEHLAGRQADIVMKKAEIPE